MLATCEKQPLSATSDIVYCKCLTIILALLCVLPVGTLAQKADTAQNPPAPLGKLFDVGGYRVHLYCTGTGSPTVVILGADYCRNHSNLRLRSFRISLERQRPERFLRASSPRSTHGIEKRWNRGAICSSGPLTRRSDRASLRGSIPRRGGRRRFYRPRICDDKSSACLRSTCNDGNNTSDATAASLRPRRQDCLGNDR